VPAVVASTTPAADTTTVVAKKIKHSNNNNNHINNYNTNTNNTAAPERFLTARVEASSGFFYKRFRSEDVSIHKMQWSGDVEFTRSRGREMPDSTRSRLKGGAFPSSALSLAGKNTHTDTHTLSLSIFESLSLSHSLSIFLSLAVYLSITPMHMNTQPASQTDIQTHTQTNTGSGVSGDVLCLSPVPRGITQDRTLMPRGTTPDATQRLRDAGLHLT
jgi:hypothetical protein